MELFDLDELKSYIKDRMKDSERLEREANSYGDESGGDFHSGQFFAYKDVLKQIHFMEDNDAYRY